MAKNNSEWQIALNKFKKSKLKEPIFITTDLTKYDAQYLLENNTKNRALSSRSVNKYLKSMQEKLWALNGETIKIGRDGELLDGQHRLKAIILYDKPIRTAVAIGIDPKFFDVIDVGTPRSSGDILSIAGYKNANSNAAAMTLFLRYIQDESIKKGTHVTPHDVLKGMEKYPHMRHFVYQALQYKDIMSASIAQCFIYIFMSINQELAYDFFYKLSTGEDLPHNSPLLDFRNFHINLKLKRLTVDKRDVHASLILTWNAYFTNNSNANIRWDGKAFPAIEGIDRKKLIKPGSGFGKKKSFLFDA